MTYKLEETITEARALLESVGQILLGKEMHEVNSLVKQLGKCEKHPTIEEFDTAHLGVNSIMYRLCNALKGIAKEGYNALGVEPSITTLPIERYMPNMKIIYDRSENQRLKHELQSHQQQLLSIANKIYHFISKDLCFLRCDLQVLIEHPEVAKAKELVLALRVIQNQLSDVEERLEDISIMIRQHKAVSYQLPSPLASYTLN
ncbi:MAG: hypothetical protein WCS87_20235 [Methylococcaceae bacterium]